MGEVLGLGLCTVDRLGIVDALPGGGVKTEISGLEVHCGGPVATALVALARWGRRCAFAGVVGDDPDGARVRTDLEADGVDASMLRVRRGATTAFAFVAIERDSGRRMLFFQRPGPGSPEVRGQDAEVLLTDGRFVEESLLLAARAGTVVVDAGSMREGTRALMEAGADVFVASEAFARELVGGDDPEGACRVMREHGVKIAGVTLGERGYVASFDDTLLQRPAHEVAVLDTTGCGDVFHAGLVEGLLSGWEPERCFDFAAWAAAACATRIGGRTGIPQRDAYPA